MTHAKTRQPFVEPVLMDSGDVPTPSKEGVQVVRPKGFEPLAFASGGQRSIQLSYGRKQRDPSEARHPSCI